MKKLFLILFCVLVASQVGAVQVHNFQKIVSQPDGTTLTLFLSGDEYSHRLHDENNYSVMKGKDGYYYYALKNNAGNVIPSGWRVGQADPGKLGIPKGIAMAPRIPDDLSGGMVPTVASRGSSFQYSMVKGDAKNIVVFINFKNSPAFENPRNHYEALFNDENAVSLRHFYKEVSYGNLDLKSGFFPKCASGENKAYVDDQPRSYFEDTMTMSKNDLMKRAIQSVREEIEATYTADELDLDQDGFVDYITFVIQGAPGEWNTFLWPHGVNLSSADGLYIHNKHAGRGVVMLEQWGVREYFCQTLAHETFHVIGCMDYYLSGRSGNFITPVYEYELMANSYGHMSAYSKWKYSKGVWIKDIPEITASGRYYLKSLISGPDSVCYKIASPVPGQYVVLEFRKKEGYYEGTLPGSGLIAYRIKQEYCGNQSANYELYIFRPGGSTRQDGELEKAYMSKESGRTALGADTDPRLFYTDPESTELQVKNNFEITDISSASGDRIYFTVTFNTQRDRIYVREGGAGTKDGSSWANAAGNLEDALKKCTSAAGSEVWMAGGNYSQNTTLALKERVSVYGGFTGTEKSVDERRMTDQNGNGRIESWEFANPTVLNFGSSGKWSTPVASGFVTEWNGLTINQLRNKLTLEEGYVFNACIFQNFVYGGVVFKGNGLLKNSLLTDCNAGAILLNLRDGGRVESCVVTKNRSMGDPIIMIGLGNIVNSLIANNEMMGVEPPVYVGMPGIVFASGSVAWGQEIINTPSSGCLQNCTVVNNKTDNSKGWISGDDQNKIRLYNTVIWGNLPSAGLTPEGVSDMKYCAVEGYTAADYAGNRIEKNISLSAANKSNETGNFYPCFVNPSPAAGYKVDGWQGGDWALGEGSACIDNGLDDRMVGEVSYDLKNAPRIMHGRIDIGAYEFEQKLPGTLVFTQLEKIYTGEALWPEYTIDPAGMNVELSCKDQNQAPVNAGEYTVTATVSDPLYEGSLTDIFTVRKADQQITWEQELGRVSSAEIRLLATVASGLPVRYESSDESIAVVEGELLKLKKSGNCTVTAHQDGDANRNPAPVVSKSVTSELQGTELKAVSLIIADGAHSGLFKLLETESLNNSRLVFYNSLGKVICDRRNYANDYDMSGLAAGTYYYVLTWRDSAGTECVKKGFVEVIK